MVENTQQLDLLLQANARGQVGWEAPSQYDLTDPADRTVLEARLENGEIKTVVDPIHEIANELYELKNPAGKNDERARTEYVNHVLDHGSTYGKWFQFPWSGELVRYPDMEDYRALRTARFVPLITTEEQADLYGATISVNGMSVGSNVVESLVQNGIGGKLITADYDTLAITNTGRVRARYSEIGDAKLDHVARQVSEVDPYIKQVHLLNGFNVEAEERLRAEGPDLIFDEVDHLPSKARLRRLAKDTGKPLVMATDLGDRSIIDVERYDLDEDIEPFNGRISSKVVDDLIEGNVPDADRMRLTMKIVGLRHITTRMLQAAMEIDQTITGLPQLGNTATIGGALATLTAREILLDRNMPSGRYVFNPKKTLNMEAQASLPESLRTIRRFVQSASANKRPA